MPATDADKMLALFSVLWKKAAAFPPSAPQADEEHAGDADSQLLRLATCISGALGLGGVCSRAVPRGDRSAAGRVGALLGEDGALPGGWGSTRRMGLCHPPSQAGQHGQAALSAGHKPGWGLGSLRTEGLEGLNFYSSWLGRTPKPAPILALL